MSGNSPEKLKRNTSPLRKQHTRLQHSLSKQYGLGVSDPSQEKYAFKVLSISPTKTKEMKEKEREDRERAERIR